MIWVHKFAPSCFHQSFRPPLHSLCILGTSVALMLTIRRESRGCAARHVLLLIIGSSAGVGSDASPFASGLALGGATRFSAGFAGSDATFSARSGSAGAGVMSGLAEVDAGLAEVGAPLRALSTSVAGETLFSNCWAHGSRMTDCKRDIALTTSEILSSSTPIS